MIKRVFEGHVDYMQILDEKGNMDQSALPSGLGDDAILEMYRQMSFARALDAKALSLQRQGRAVTYAPLLGQEATQIGAALAMRKSDLFVPNFRQHGVFIARGVPLYNIFMFWRGFEEGNIISRELGVFPYIVPVSSQMPHAAGIAFAQKYKGADAAVVAFCGDGGTSEGDFYEALNFAGVFKLPLVAIIENNQWAISVPRKNQSAAETLAQKGIAAGVEVMQVDGNDVIAVYKAVGDAIGRAKAGTTLIECVTYRMSMHTTADDPTKYRPDAEVEAWKQRDPIARVGTYLRAKGLWDDQKEAGMQEGFKKTIDEGVEKAEQFKPDPKSMFDNVYSFMPQTLKDEYDEAVKEGFWQQQR